MSVSQYSNAVDSITVEKLASPDDLHYHLVYDFPQLYKSSFPNLKHSMVGCIPNWEFHINDLGKANIRPTFDIKVDGSKPYGKNYLLPSPGLKEKHTLSRESFLVYGVVFALNQKDDEIAEKYFAQPQEHRHRVQCNAVLGRNGRNYELQVSVFVDLKNTCTGFNQNLLKSQEDINKWRRTIDIFRKAEVPETYLKYLKAEVRGRIPSRISPIHVDSEAYLSDIPDIPADEHAEKADHELIEQPLPPKAAFLRKKYYEKYGKLAPLCPTNRRQARVFDEYHDALLRSRADTEAEDTAHLNAAVSYSDWLASRADDGLDVYDAIREDHGQSPWKHPNTVRGPAENGVMKDVAGALTGAAPDFSRKHATSLSHKRKQPPPNLLIPGPDGATPAKKQKVQQPSADGGPQVPGKQQPENHLA
ncbi:hypothetical protein VTL71DRAFT_10617 [Oculimacula yallundae]|uniref:Uncharacterized protein n=1 Tax=Oculimacula yallundae TaxID=86028 RepID=A0ABR4CTI5_9HELO